jgi:hypothetical protein
MKYRTFVKFSIVEVPIILQTEPKANLKWVIQSLLKPFWSYFTAIKKLVNSL